MSVWKSWGKAKRQRSMEPHLDTATHEEHLLSVGIRALSPRVVPSDKLSRHIWNLAEATERDHKRRQVQRRWAGMSVATASLVLVGVNMPQITARVGLARAARQLSRVQASGSLRVTRETFVGGRSLVSTLRTDGTNSVFKGEGTLIAQDEVGTRYLQVGNTHEFPGSLDQYGEYGQSIQSNLDLKEQQWLAQAAYPYVIQWKNFPSLDVSLSEPDPELAHWSLDDRGRLTGAVLVFNDRRLMSLSINPETGLLTKLEERPESQDKLTHRVQFASDAPFPSNWTRHTEGKRSIVEERERQEYLKNVGGRVIQSFPFFPVNLYIHDAFRTTDGDIFVFYSAQEGASAQNYRLIQEKIALELSAVDQSGTHYTPVKTKASFVQINGTFGGAVPLLVGPTANKTPAQCFWLTPVRANVKSATPHEKHTFRLSPGGSVEATDVIRLIINGDVRKDSPIPVLDKEPLVFKDSHWPAPLRGQWASDLSREELAQLRAEAKRAYQRTHPHGPQ